MMKIKRLVKFLFISTLTCLCISPIFVEAIPEIVFNVGHTDDITAVVYSPSAKYVASASNDKTIKIWEVESGRYLRTLKGHGSYVKSIAYSPDGKHIASASWDDTVKIWNVVTGNCIRTCRHTKDANAVTYSPDGAFLASASDDKTVKLWDAATGACVKTFIGHEKDVTSVSFSPDGTHIVSGSLDHSVKIWNVASGECVQTFGGDIADVKAVVYSPDAKYVVGIAWNNAIKIWELETGRLLRILNDHSLEVNSITFSPDGKYMVSSSMDRTFKLWEVESGKCIKTFARGEEYATSIVYSPDGAYLVSSSNDRKIKFWEVATGHFIKALTDETNWVKSVVYSPDGKYFATSSPDHTIKIMDADTGRLLQILEGHTNWVKPVVYSPDGKFLASAGYKTIRCWEVATGKYAKVMIGHTKNVNQVVYSPNGKYLASVSSDKTLKLWDVATEECIKTFEGKIEGNLVCFSPDGMYLASDGEEKTLKIWDVESGESLKMFSGHEVDITSIAYSPDGAYLVSSSTDKTIKIWDVESAECIKTISEYSGAVESVVYSPDGSYLAALAWDDASAKIWDVKTGKCIHTLKGHKDWINAVAYSPDGKVLATSSLDSTVKFWNARTGELLATTFNLREGEWLTYTSEGFFAGSEIAREDLIYIVDEVKNISIERVFDALYRPDLVVAKLRGKDISEHAKKVNLSMLKRSGLPPSVSITDISEKDEMGNVTLEYSIQNTGGGIGEVILSLNGKNIRLAEKMSSNKNEVLQASYTVALQKGKNTFELYAKNEEGTIESVRASDAVMWRGEKNKPSLYVLAVAINQYKDKNMQLKYAVPNAKLITQVLSKQKKSLYQNIYTSNLFDGEATKEGLYEAFKKLESQVQADDIFILYLAGQGMAGKDGQAYFLPFDFNYKNLESIENYAISTVDIVNSLSFIKTGKTLLLIDACDATTFLNLKNKADKDNLEKDGNNSMDMELSANMREKTAIERLSHSTGRATIATFLKGNIGREEYKSGYGIFAYLLAQGLKGDADVDGDDFISMKELTAYVTEELPRHSYKKWKVFQEVLQDLKEKNFLVMVSSKKKKNEE